MTAVVLTEAEREALAEALEDVLVDYDERGHMFGTSGAGALFLANHIVGSEWLNAVRAQAKADALREAADDCDNDWRQSTPKGIAWLLRVRADQNAPTAEVSS